MQTTTRTVAHALFDYTRLRTVTHVDQQSGAIGERQQPYTATAMRGQVIEVNDADLERGERLGALVDGELPTIPSPLPSPPVTPEVAGGSEPAEAHPSATGLDVDSSVAVHPGHDAPARPKTVAKHAAWVDYAVERGMNREEAESLTKDELIERFPSS